MPGSFIERELSFAFALANDTFEGTSSNTVSVTGLRAQVTINRGGLPAVATATMRIYGMSQTLMQQLSSLGVLSYIGRRNVVTVSAGDAENGMAVAFSGIITEAWADFSAAPEVGFSVNADSSSLGRLIPVPATSVKGPGDVATMIAGLANQAGYEFENNGVSGISLSNPYYFGSAITQAEAIARDTGIGMAHDDASGVQLLAIWPPGGHRQTDLVPLISAATGMVGYPQYSGTNEIGIRCLFNPSIRIARLIQVKSLTSPQATGTWFVKASRTASPPLPRTVTGLATWLGSRRLRWQSRTGTARTLCRHP